MQNSLVHICVFHLSSISIVKSLALILCMKLSIKCCSSLLKENISVLEHIWSRKTSKGKREKYGLYVILRILDFMQQTSA